MTRETDRGSHAGRAARTEARAREEVAHAQRHRPMRVLRCGKRIGMTTSARSHWPAGRVSGGPKVSMTANRGDTAREQVNAARRCGRACPRVTSIGWQGEGTEEKKHWPSRQPAFVQCRGTKKNSSEELHKARGAETAGSETETWQKFAADPVRLDRARVFPAPDRDWWLCSPKA
ncbi:hypothetical protein ERJ75_001790200 [Trypanosoma vivax]|nr:hypothetical protein ERJ75_001790200 [Trypanosoma vivax]